MEWAWTVMRHATAVRHRASTAPVLWLQYMKVVGIADGLAVPVLRR